MPMGPIEVVAVSFPGSHFNGQIAPALADAVDSGDIRIIDLALVAKSADGEITIVELNELEDEATAAFDDAVDELLGLLNEDDLAVFGAALAPGSSAAVLVFEQVWARRLAEAVGASDGEVIFHEHIPRDVVEAAVAAAVALEA